MLMLRLLCTCYMRIIRLFRTYYVLIAYLSYDYYIQRIFDILRIRLFLRLFVCLVYAYFTQGIRRSFAYYMIVKRLLYAYCPLVICLFCA